jgi:hypothetical protein
MFEVFGLGLYINDFYFMDVNKLLDRVVTVKRDPLYSHWQERQFPDLPLIALVIEFNSSDQLQVLCTSVEVETMPLCD